MDNKTKSILNVCGLAASSNQDVLLLVDGKFITGTLVLKTETDDIVNQVISWAKNELDENSDSSFITLKNISSVGDHGNLSTSVMIVYLSSISAISLVARDE